MFGEGGTAGGTDNSIWVLAGDREEGGPGKGCGAWRGTALAARPGHPVGPTLPARLWHRSRRRKAGLGGSSPPERVLESVGANTQPFGQGMREHCLTAVRGGQRDAASGGCVLPP